MSRPGRDAAVLPFSARSFSSNRGLSRVERASLFLRLLVLFILLSTFGAPVGGSGTEARAAEPRPDAVRRLLWWIEGKPFEMDILVGGAEGDGPRWQRIRVDASSGSAPQRLFEDAAASGSPLALEILVRIGSGDERGFSRRFNRPVRNAAVSKLFSTRAVDLVDVMIEELLPNRHRYTLRGRMLLLDVLLEASAGRESILGVSKPDGVRVRERVAWALLRVARDPQEDPRVRCLAVNGLSRLGTPAIAPLVAGSIRSRDAALRVAAARAVEKIFREAGDAARDSGAPVPARGLLDAAASRLVAELLFETSPYVQEAIVSALGRWPSVRTIDELALWLARTTLHPDVVVRAHRALRALTGKAMPDEAEPGAWLAWWESVRGAFELPPSSSAETDPRYGASGAHFYGVPIRGKSVEFVLDYSPSMMGAPIARLREEMDRAFRTLHGKVEFDIVLFSSFHLEWLKRRVRVGPRSVAAAKRFLMRPTMGGGTDILVGLRHALGRERDGDRRRGARRRPDQIILITDGGHGGESTFYEVLTDVRCYNRDLRTRVDVVLVEPSLGHRWLERLAEENGGVLRHAR